MLDHRSQIILINYLIFEGDHFNLASTDRQSSSFASSSTPRSPSSRSPPPSTSCTPAWKTSLPSPRSPSSRGSSTPARRSILPVVLPTRTSRSIARSRPGLLRISGSFRGEGSFIFPPEWGPHNLLKHNYKRNSNDFLLLHI